MAWTRPARKSAEDGIERPASNAIASVRAATSRRVRLDPTSPMSGLSSPTRRRQASMTRTPASTRISGTHPRNSVPRAERDDPPVVRVPLVVADVQARETVGEGIVDVVEVGEVGRPDGDERAGEALPRFGRGDRALLQGLEQHVLSAEGQFSDLVDEQEASVGLQQLSRLEHERAHRVADLLQLAEIDVAGEVVREHFRAPLQPGKAEPLAQPDVLAGHLRRVDAGGVEQGGISTGGEPSGADRARREALRDGRVDDAERMVEHGAAFDDPGALGIEIPEVLREAGLSGPGRAEEQDVRAGDDRGDHILVRGLGQDRVGEEGANGRRAVEALRPQRRETSQDFRTEGFARRFDRFLGRA